MRRTLTFISLFLISCRLFLPFTSPERANSPQITPEFSPSAALLATPTLTLPLAPTPQPAPASGFLVRYHPDGELFVGDQISFEVIAPSGQNLSDQQITIESVGPETEEIASGDFHPFGIGERYQATFQWAWDTRALSPGGYTLKFSLTPGDISWTEGITLLPASSLGEPEKDARWEEAASDCCLIYYLTGTEAERDLPDLIMLIDQQAQLAATHTGAAFDDQLSVVLMPRLLGQGGFANEEIYISYLDRNYTGNSPEIVIHHEMVHVLDGVQGGDLRPTMFVEGLAVYLSGGHYRPEPLIPKAAAILNRGMYLPLAPLADNFYLSQHEISYLEAGALVQFMVDTWGQDAFNAFYRDIHPSGNGSQSEAIDTALQLHFDLTFSELEERFTTLLESQPVNLGLEKDVRLTVDFFDTVRRYQQVLDPSAYFLTAWFPNREEMQDRGIVADLIRHPIAPENLALETMLGSAGQELQSGELAKTELLTSAVNAVLDAYEKGDPAPFYAHPLATDYLAITLAVLAVGRQPQRIEVQGPLARVWVQEPEGTLTELEFVREASSWAPK